MGPPHGSLKGLSTVNGRRQALSYGPTGIVWFFIISRPMSLIVSGFVAGSGKSILWWATLRQTFVDVANIRHQFVNYKGHRIITCNWIGFNCLLLL